MELLKLLAQNWDSVAIVLVFVVVLIVLFKKGKTNIIKEILVQLVTEAETKYGSGTGALKKAAVIQWLYERLPAVLRLFITAKEIEKLLDKALAYAKTEWAKNPALLKPPDATPGADNKTE